MILCFLLLRKLLSVCIKPLRHHGFDPIAAALLIPLALGDQVHDPFPGLIARYPGEAVVLIGDIDTLRQIVNAGAAVHLLRRQVEISLPTHLRISVFQLRGIHLLQIDAMFGGRQNDALRAMHLLRCEPVVMVRMHGIDHGGVCLRSQDIHPALLHFILKILILRLLLQIHAFL